jgi:DNA polymerase-4
VDADPSRRTMSAEQTYEEDLVGSEAVGATLLQHAVRVARRLILGGECARVVILKVKYSDFALRTRRKTLPEPVQDTDAIHRAACELLSQVPLQDRRVRLTGVGVASIEHGPPPRTLLPDAQAEKRRKVEEVTAEIAARFGDARQVTRATLLGRRLERR